MEFEHDLERENFWIIQYGDVICPECKAQFDDAIFLMVRDDFKFRYCPNCGKPVKKNYGVENDE